MSDFCTLITDHKVHELHRSIENGRQKYLVYTRLTDEWIVGATDGSSVWQLQLDNEELETHRDLATINTTEALLTRFRNAFESGDLSVALIGTKLSLTVGKGSSALTIDLYEAKVSVKKVEMQSILFRLAEVATSTDKKFAEATKTIETLKAQKGAGGHNAFMDLGPKKGANPAKNIQKKAGMSILNPSSRKRKAAQGVVFD